MIIDILGYRDWAHELAHTLGELVDDRTFANTGSNLKVHWHAHLADTCLPSYHVAVFAVGWSEEIPEDFLTSRPVFVLHPSPLPRYAGGSPIQHQILKGEKTSAVTIFRLAEAVKYGNYDSGPIAWSMPYSLEGEMADILRQIGQIGTIGIKTLIDQASLVGWEGLALLPQPTDREVWRRRRPNESEITPDMLAGWTAEQLHNFVRALQDPYPNAFIRTHDGGRLYITKTRAAQAPTLEGGPT